MNFLCSKILGSSKHLCYNKIDNKHLAVREVFSYFPQSNNLSNCSKIASP
ncbi:unnamed protein product [Moneuplotes crassus]|uniref:Uncharacterized protein n=1 Tax=Euplotes crassus TaxID=5936 RepID=A0AAD1XXQ0_EUPCR|nr:unnamed protein product [Moneuplotes crassus]